MPGVRLGLTRRAPALRVADQPGHDDAEKRADDIREPHLAKISGEPVGHWTLGSLHVALTVHLRGKPQKPTCRKTLEFMVERKGIQFTRKVLFTQIILRGSHDTPHGTPVEISRSSRLRWQTNSAKFIVLATTRATEQGSGVSVRKVIVTPYFANYPSEWHFSPGLDTGDFVFFSRITGTRPDLSIANDPESQFRDAFRFLGANLTQAELQFRGHRGGNDVSRRPHMRVKDEFIAEPYPAWTAVGVSELITDGALVEIRVIAKRG